MGKQPGPQMVGLFGRFRRVGAVHHFHQGPGGMLGTGFVGLVYGIVYLVSGRNLWVTIIAHGLTGSSSFILLYLSQLQ